MNNLSNNAIDQERDDIRVTLHIGAMPFGDYTIHLTQENPLDDIYEVKTSKGGGSYGHVVRALGESYETVVARALSLIAGPE